MGSLPQIGNNSRDVFYAETYERMGKMLRLIKINDTHRADDVEEICIGHIYFNKLETYKTVRNGEII